MKLWQFIHLSLNMHMFVFLMFIVFAAMVIIAVVHHSNVKKRDKANEEELETLKGGTAAPASSSTKA